MTRRMRIVVGIVILAVSMSLLIWGFAPMRREIRTQPIAPAELQLLAPSSLRIQPIPAS